MRLGLANFFAFGEGGGRFISDGDGGGSSTGSTGFGRGCDMSFSSSPSESCSLVASFVVGIPDTATVGTS